MSRHNVWIPDELWRRIQQAAANESAERGQTVSASQWIREACEKRLRTPPDSEADTRATEGET